MRELNNVQSSQDNRTWCRPRVWFYTALHPSFENLISKFWIKMILKDMPMVTRRTMISSLMRNTAYTTYTVNTFRHTVTVYHMLSCMMLLIILWNEIRYAIWYWISSNQNYFASDGARDCCSKVSSKGPSVSNLHQIQRARLGSCKRLAREPKKTIHSDKSLQTIHNNLCWQDLE